MLSSNAHINDLREVQHYLLKQAQLLEATNYYYDAGHRERTHGIAVGYRNAYHRVTELLEQWEKQLVT